MDPAEEIVNLWLQQKGFFVMNDVKVGYYGKEADFLAIAPKTDRRVHVEVHAAVIPLGKFRPWGPVRYSKMPLDERVKLYYEKKFRGSVDQSSFALKNTCIEDKIGEVFGTNDYEKWLVFGVLHKGESRQELETEFAKHRVKVFFLEDILKEIAIEGTAKDSTGRFLQLLAAQLTDEAKDSLLGRKKR